MSMSDPISDLLTRIRNGLHAKRDVVEVPASRMKAEMCRVLKDCGYIEDVSTIEDDKQGMLRLTLRYTHEGQPVIHGLQRVSKPSLRVFVSCDEIKPVRSGLGVCILTTSKGLMTGKQARSARVGGEVLCEVW